MLDDRWVQLIGRDALGYPMHLEMIEQFALYGNMEKTHALARRLSANEFEGFQYFERAQRLLSQLEERLEKPLGLSPADGHRMEGNFRPV